MKLHGEIKRVTDTHIICECDRKFLINDKPEAEHSRLQENGHNQFVEAMDNIYQETVSAVETGAFQG